MRENLIQAFRPIVEIPPQGVIPLFGYGAWPVLWNEAKFGHFRLDWIEKISKVLQENRSKAVHRGAVKLPVFLKLDVGTDKARECS